VIIQPGQPAVIARRDSPIDDELAVLCSALTAGPADAVCSVAMAAMARNAPADDIALLVLTRRPADGPACS
jgi:hypothetical protein